MNLTQALLDMFPYLEGHTQTAYDELTIEVGHANVHDMLKQLKTHESFLFDTLIDVCGVDYLYYGQADWETDSASTTGFSRAKEPHELVDVIWNKPRFAVVYHLLSTQKNHRLRVKVYLEETHLMLPSVCDIWKVANWFERETYDLYGILFSNHPDLRRILTDYGFIGYPFRKDFPVSGHVEVRYDATIGHVIYEPVDIQPRVTVPKVIRHDNRYVSDGGEKS
jgi:NADH-quinone oxidoreductase subunit C